MQHHWHKKKIQLTYWFGEFRLFSKSYKLHTCNIDYLTTPPFDPSGLSLPALCETENTPGVLLYSYPVGHIAARIFTWENYLGYFIKDYQRFFVRIDSSYEEYLNKFSAKTRSTFRRKIRKFETVSGGMLDWKIYATPEEMDAFYPLARQVSEKSYQEKLLDAGLPTSEEFRDEMKQLAEQNRVRGYLLFHDGQPVSYMYCPIENTCMIYAYLGYDPDYGRYSVGTILMLLVLENLFESRDAAIFDFTEGQSDHKKLFATDSVKCANILLLRKSAGALFWIYLHYGLCGLSENIVRGLDKLGLKNKLKKLIRRTA
ncbi:GNAT family N-acetyltransferase [Luteithermobacter gelatinilyticus]|uniref:GNAT family N-acetyltransferase n=1 Tax=Luteithermobacter gelatinilyticus TaxID=2582913 RepID=UPI0011063BBC|nr:GNAT family N-acetyltransferase [Luteithermobacter gelatinilyticus]